MYFEKTAGVSKRLSVLIDDIRRAKHLCKTIEEDLRWPVALVSAKVMRLAESVGLLRSDIDLDSKVYHISL